MLYIFDNLVDVRFVSCTVRLCGVTTTHAAAVYILASLRAHRSDASRAGGQISVFFPLVCFSASPPPIVIVHGVTRRPRGITWPRFPGGEGRSLFLSRPPPNYQFPACGAVGAVRQIYCTVRIAA